MFLNSVKSDEEQINRNYKEEVKFLWLFPINLIGSHVSLALIQANGEMKAEGSQGQSEILVHHKCPSTDYNFGQGTIGRTWNSGIRSF